MEPVNAPPPVLDYARVIAYAIVDDSVEWTGRQTIFVDGKELGPVPRLAIAQIISGELKDTFLVFHCDNEWQVMGFSGGDTVEAAKAATERAYRGISAKWISMNVTEEEANAWIRDNYRDMSCSFCDRQPGDFEMLIESKSGNARVCDQCIEEHYKAIRQDLCGNDVA